MCRFPRIKFTRRQLILVAPVAAALWALLFSCSKPPPPPVEKEPEMTLAERQAEQRKRHLAELDDRLKKARRIIEANPTSFVTNLNNLRSIQFSAKDTPRADEVEKLIEEQKNAVEELAAKSLDALLPEVNALLKKNQYRAAEDKLNEFREVEGIPEELFGKTKAYQRFLAELDRVIDAEGAEAEYLSIKREAAAYRRQYEIAKAIGVLESYPIRYSDTSFGKEIRGLVDEYYQDYLKEKAEKLKVAEMVFEKVKIDKYLSAFKVAGKRDTFKGETDGDQPTVVGHNSSDKDGAYLQIGEDDWQDWIVTFEAKVPEPELLLGITNFPQKRNKQWASFKIDTKADEWIPYRVELRTGSWKVIDVETKEVIGEGTAEFASGSVAFLLHPGQSIQVRQVEFKVLSKIEPPSDTDASAGEDPDDGEAEEG